MTGATEMATTVVAHARRERPRAILRAAFPRRKARLLLTRTAEEVAGALRASLIDAVIVDLAAGQEEAWKLAALADDHPTTAFFAMTPLRVADAAAIAACAQRSWAGVLVEGVDDAVVRDIVTPASFSARFSRALADPPVNLGLRTTLQRQAWTQIVSRAGRQVRTDAIAKEMGLTREHLSRSFSAEGPNLKRVIDLVRVIAAAELAKNPGLDLKDVSAVLGFASPSHLSITSQRIAGTRPVSLTRLRTVDIVDRFVRGNGRSRG